MENNNTHQAFSRLDFIGLAHEENLTEVAYRLQGATLLLNAIAEQDDLGPEGYALFSVLETVLIDLNRRVEILILAEVD